MSDPVQVAEKKVNGFIAFFKKIGSAIYAVLKQLWALVSDHNWDFDPWKLGGIAAYVFSAWGGAKVFALAEKGTDSMTLGVLAGVVTAFITVGTFLFGQSKDHDNALIGK